jgi:PTS system nitrogen regulatory IIA component
MADDDFDLDSLAEYLHLGAPQLLKMAERGQLPGRKVGGHWRFYREEILVWLEDRIGASDSAELERVESALEHATGPRDEALLTLTELLPIEAIEIPLPARTRNSVMSSMIDVAARTGWLWDPPKMLEAVRSREDLYPTALETGVAMLHPRRPLSNILGRAFIALGITETGIPFGSSRGSLTDTFFLICSTDDRGHLHALARLSRLLNQPDFLAELRSAPDSHAAHEVIAAREKALLE